MPGPKNVNSNDRRLPAGGRRLWRDISVLASGQILAQLANLLALAVVARHLEVGEFGLIQVAIAASAYLMVAAEMGLFTHGMRDLARMNDAPAIRTRVKTQRSLLIVLAVAGVAVGWLVLPLLPVYHEAPTVFHLYLLALLPQAFMLDWVALGRSLPLIAGTGRALRSIVNALLIVGLAWRLDGALGWPLLHWIPVLYLAAFVVGNAVVADLVRREVGKGLGFAWRESTPWLITLRETVPIGGAHVIRRLLFNVDLLLLGALASSEEAGRYAAAAKLGFPLVVGAEVAMGALLPRLSRAWSEGAGAFALALRRQLGAMVSIVAVVAGLGIWLGPPLVPMLFGEAYRGGADVLFLVLPAYALLGIGILLHDAQVAADRPKGALIPLGIAVVLGVGTGVFWIPDAGADGAARAILMSNGIYALGGFWRCRRLLMG